MSDQNRENENYSGIANTNENAAAPSGSDPAVRPTIRGAAAMGADTTAETPSVAPATQAAPGDWFAQRQDNATEKLPPYPDGTAAREQENTEPVSTQPLDPLFAAQPGPQPAPQFTAQPKPEQWRQSDGARQPEPAPWQTGPGAGTAAPSGIPNGGTPNQAWGNNTFGYTPTPPFGAANGQPLPPLKPREKERKGPGWGSLFAACLVTAALTFGAAFAIIPNTETPTSSLTLSNERKTPTVNPTPASSNSTDWEAVAKAVRPAVVAIQVSDGSSADDGSGVIFDNQGHILTNHHVVANAVTGKAKIIISLTDGTLYSAKVVGTDPTTDLAVLKIQNPPKDLIAAQLGSSANLLVGQPIAAIGNPLGLSSTMTTGIISALNRPVVVRQAKGDSRDNQGDPVITNAIQVDASINPGNSGGPLFDATGKVIGINSSIASLGSSQETAGSIGLGFAIPVDLAKMIAKQLIETGHAVHAYLGVSIIPGQGEADNEVRTGAEIRRVVAGSPAAQAGLKVGDLVISIDGQSVGSGPALTGYIRRYPVGAKVKLTYIRDGKTNTVEATLAQAPSN